MTRGEAIAAALAVAAAAAVIGWHAGGLRVTARAELSADASAPRPGDLPAYAARGHLSGDVPGLHDRHPLHRRHDGHAMRAALAAGGWDWFLNPPAEASL